jgi:hypothetical protein
MRGIPQENIGYGKSSLLFYPNRFPFYDGKNVFWRNNHEPIPFKPSHENRQYARKATSMQDEKVTPFNMKMSSKFSFCVPVDTGIVNIL